jgi:hypothetical protein
MTETTPSPLGTVITIDDERIKSHLDRVIRGSVEETLNALLDAEADRLCNDSADMSLRFSLITFLRLGDFVGF